MKCYRNFLVENILGKLFKNCFYNFVLVYGVVLKVENVKKDKFVFDKDRLWWDFWRYWLVIDY